MSQPKCLMQSGHLTLNGTVLTTMQTEDENCNVRIQWDSNAGFLENGTYCVESKTPAFMHCYYVTVYGESHCICQY